MLRPLSTLGAAFLLSFGLLGAAPHASADSRSDCEAAVRARFEKRLPKAKRLQISSKVKIVSDAKKRRDELSGSAKYVGREGRKRELTWKCVVKNGKVEDVHLNLEE